MDQESDRGGGQALSWKPCCPLPRIICLNIQVPYKAGSSLQKAHPRDDHGLSIIAFFHIKGETLQMLRNPDPPPCLRLLKDFVEGGSMDLPRPNGANKTTGLFKGIAHAENVDDVGVPFLLKPTVLKYHHKPVLMTKSGKVFKSTDGEWMEIGVDVRRFSSFAKNMLVTLRDLLPEASVHFGFTIQGQEDEDLPEGILFDLRLHYANLAMDPKWIDDNLA